MRIGTILGTLLAAAAGAALTVAADEPKPADAGTLVVIDSAGKDQKLKSWKFTAGTRALSWLAPAGADKDPFDKDNTADKKTPRPGRKPAAGPEALEFREENSTTFVDGILTLVPLARIRSIDYDDKDGVAVRVAVSDKAEADEVIKGTTRFKQINKLTIEAEVDKGDLGVAEIKYLGGVPKGIRGLRFPAPKAPAAGTPGRGASVTVNDKQKGPYKILDLQPLYRFEDGSEQLVPTLLFKKTLKIDVAKLKKLRAAGDPEREGAPLGVTLKGGEEETFTLLKTVTLNDKPAVLEGLLGRVPAGYKLFPLHTITEVEFEEDKAGDKQ
jgi:hypothetical protein